MPSNRYRNDLNAKAGGDISDAFSSMSGDIKDALPDRYSALKKALAPTADTQDSIVRAWREVLSDLGELTARIRDTGPSMIPQVQYKDIQNGTLSPKDIEAIRTVGTVIVKGIIPQEVALGWKETVKEYATANRKLAKGFPAENPQVWEFYHTKSQIDARTHPAYLAIQKYLLGLWDASPTSEVAFDTPISYFDRLRIRFPGDAKFALGPHIDGGSVERWEDPTYRKCFSNLLSSKWKEHNPFDGTHRVNAVMDMYKGQGACNVFRPWQGWVSMSTTRAYEGTLRVFPNIGISSAYLLLRPFFQPVRSDFENKSEYLDPSNWVLDLESTAFPGSIPGSGQELRDNTHPHLQLEHTMTSLPLVEPGDYVAWHCDVIHAVEAQHRGKGDSSVMYIPAVPLTVNNAEYLASQRESFLTGYAPFDFSGPGEGETRFVGRATKQDVHPEIEAQRAMGFERFVSAGSDQAKAELVRKANECLFSQGQ